MIEKLTEDLAQANNGDSSVLGSSTLTRHRKGDSISESVLLTHPKIKDIEERIKQLEDQNSSLQLNNDALNKDYQTLRKNYKIVYNQLVEKQDEVEIANEKL